MGQGAEQLLLLVRRMHKSTLLETVFGLTTRLDVIGCLGVRSFCRFRHLVPGQA